MIIESFEHYCSDGCGGEVLERYGSITRVKRWRILLDSGKYVGIAFKTQDLAQAYVDTISH